MNIKKKYVTPVTELISVCGKTALLEPTPYYGTARGVDQNNETQFSQFGVEEHTNEGEEETVGNAKRNPWDWDTGYDE